LIFDEGKGSVKRALSEALLPDKVRYIELKITFYRRGKEQRSIFEQQQNHFRQKKKGCHQKGP
jgi:hypothetical protein